MPDTPEEHEASGPEPGTPEPFDGEEAPAPTPFDHPMFLPVLLFAFALWFGYDGFLNDDPDMMEHQGFNRGGFVLWVVLMLYYGYKGIREMREDAAGAGDCEPGDGE